MFIRGAPLTFTFVPIFQFATTRRVSRDVENGGLYEGHHSLAHLSPIFHIASTRRESRDVENGRL